MPECHKCRFNGKGSVACLACKGPDVRHTIGHGSSRAARGRVVSLDAIAEQSRGDIDRNSAARQMSALADKIGAPPTFNCTEAQELAVRQALQALSSMGDELALLFLGIVRGNSLASTARRLRISRNALYVAIRRLRKESPELAAILGTAQAANEVDEDVGAYAEQMEMSFYDR